MATFCRKIVLLEGKEEVGAVGVRGPVPKRSEDRRGHHSRDERPPIKSAPAGKRHRPPAASKEWHPIAVRLYNSAKKSGQSAFYEASDWAMLYSLCDDLSYYKSQAKRSGQMLASVMSGLSSLLLTEGDRRRVQIELEQPEDDLSAHEAHVARMEDWRARLSS